MERFDSYYPHSGVFGFPPVGPPVDTSDLCILAVDPQDVVLLVGDEDQHSRRSRIAGLC
jgi:hypothetical protein